MAERQIGVDMLHGTLWDKILRYALPLAATGICQQLFNATVIAGAAPHTISRSSPTTS